MVNEVILAPGDPKIRHMPHSPDGIQTAIGHDTDRRRPTLLQDLQDNPSSPGRQLDIA